MKVGLFISLQHYNTITPNSKEKKGNCFCIQVHFFHLSPLAKAQIAPIMLAFQMIHICYIHTPLHLYLKVNISIWNVKHNSLQTSRSNYRYLKKKTHKVFLFNKPQPVVWKSCTHSRVHYYSQEFEFQLLYLKKSPLGPSSTKGSGE